GTSAVLPDLRAGFGRGGEGGARQSWRGGDCRMEEDQERNRCGGRDALVRGGSSEDAVSCGAVGEWAAGEAGGEGTRVGREPGGVRPGDQLDGARHVRAAVCRGRKDGVRCLRYARASVGKPSRWIAEGRVHGGLAARGGIRRDGGGSADVSGAGAVGDICGAAAGSGAEGAGLHDVPSRLPRDDRVSVPRRGKSLDRRLAGESIQHRAPLEWAGGGAGDRVRQFAFRRRAQEERRARAVFGCADLSVDRRSGETGAGIYDLSIRNTARVRRSQGRSVRAWSPDRHAPLTNGRALRPKSRSTRSYQASSSSAFHSIHSSSVMLLRQARKPSASGPTGCRSGTAGFWTISRIFSATTVGGVGF